MRIPILVSFAVVLSSNVLCPQNVPAGASAVHSYSLKGTVVEAATGHTIPGALVVVQPIVASEGSVIGTESSPDGHFEVKNVPMGRYVIFAEKGGYLVDNSGASHGYLVNLGRNTEGITLSLVYPSVITGTVRDDQGSPVKKALVQVTRLTIFEGMFRFSRVATVLTDDTGTYRAFDLPPGTFIIASYFRDNRSILGLRHRAGGDGAGMAEDFAATYYSGTLTWAEAIPINVRAGETVTGVDITLRKVPCGSIEGVVSGRPANGGSLLVSLGSADETLGPTQVYRLSETSDRFRFRSLPPGSYSLRVNSTQGRAVYSGRVDIFLSSGEEIVDVVLPMGENRPLQARAVWPSNSQNVKKLVLSLSGRGRTAKIDFPTFQGNATQLPPLPADTYSLALKEPVVGWFIKAVKVGAAEYQPGKIPIDARVSSIEAIISDEAATIEGQVEGLRPSDLLSRIVVLVEAAGDYGRVWSSRLDEHYRYRFEALQPGTYRIGVIKGQNDQSLDTNEVLSVQRSGSSVRIESGGEVVLNIAPLSAL